MREKDRDIVFTGYYGMQNTGDDAFCVVCGWGARHFWRREKVGFLSQSIPVMLGFGEPLLRPHKRFCGQRFLEVIKILSKKRLVVLGGGSVFHSSIGILTPRSLMRVTNGLGLTKLGAIGISLGPFVNTKAEREIQEFLKRFSFLVLRDKKSYETALSMNLPYPPVEATDLAFLMPEVYGKEGGTKRELNNLPVLGITLCHSERYVNGDIRKERSREYAILSALKELAKTVPVRFRFFIFNSHPKYGDIDLTRETADKLSAQAAVEVVDYSMDVGLTWKRVAECSSFLSVRLHGGIFACAARIPFLLVEYHRKCSDFLDDIGWPRFLRIGDMDVSPKEIAGKLGQIVSDTTRHFPVDLEMIRNKAKENFCHDSVMKVCL